MPRDIIKQRQRQAEYRERNREKLREKSKIYKENNREKIAIYDTEYRKAHKEQKNSARRRNYKPPTKEKRAELSKKDSQNSRIRLERYRAKKKSLIRNFTKNEWEYCKKYFHDSCAYCGSVGPLVQEHFIPLSRDGEYTVNNIVPACVKCNASKKDSDFYDWYENQSSYSKERKDKIIKYLNSNKKLALII